MKMNFSNSVILLTAVLFFSCGNKKQERPANLEQIEIESSKEDGLESDVLSNEETFEFAIAEVIIKPLPVDDSTNFDDFDFANKLMQSQVRALKLDTTFDNVDEFYLSYRVDLSENFISLIINYLMGEHELFTALINYDSEFNIISSLDIAYDEIAESAFRKTSTIDTQKIIVVATNHFENEILTSYYKINTNGVFMMEHE